MLPEIECLQAAGKQLAFRVGAGFAKREIYEALEERGVDYVVRTWASTSLELERSKIFCSTRRAGRA